MSSLIRRLSVCGSRPPTDMVPPSRGMSPSEALMNVLLPAPFGPRRPMTPRGMSAVNPFSAMTAPNRTVTSLAARMIESSLCGSGLGCAPVPASVRHAPWLSYRLVQNSSRQRGELVYSRGIVPTTLSFPPSSCASTALEPGLNASPFCSWRESVGLLQSDPVDTSSTLAGTNCIQWPT